MLQPSGFQPGVAEVRETHRRRWLAEGLHSGLTIPQAVAKGAPARLIIRSDTRPVDLTGDQIRERAQGIAGALHSLGVRRGDVVSFQMPTWAEALYVSFATYMLGAVSTPIISIYGPKEVGFILKQSRAKVFITPDRWGSNDHLAAMDQWPDLPDLEHVVVLGERTRAGTMTWDDFTARADRDVVSPEISPDDLAVLIYTSGTTSDPKGVVHSHSTLMAENLRRRRRGASGTILAALPMGHIGGIMTPMSLMIDGGTVVSVDKWSAPVAAALTEEFKVTSMGGTPFFLTTLLDAGRANGRDMSSLTDFMLGATAITPTDVLGCESLGIKAYRTYGSTEHPIAITGGPEDDRYIRSSTDGFPIDGTQVRLVDDTGQDVPEGEPGEIALLGAQQFIGYTDPALNQAQFLPGGWYLTGDVARRDPTGAYILTDRKKDIIIRGGENISSKEVEDALASLPGVLEAAVVAMPDPRYGEKVCAFVIAPGLTLTLDEIGRHFAATGLARQKTPERIEVVDDFPRTPTGKIKKFELRARLVTETA